MIIVQYVIIGYIIVQTGVSLLTEFAVNRGNRPKEMFRKTRPLRIAVYVLLAAVPCLGAFLPNSEVKYFFMGAGNIWLGYFLYYSGMMLTASAIAAIVCLIRRDKEKRVFSIIFYISAAAALVITVYGMIHAQNTKVVTYDISTVSEGKQPTDKLKVVLLADLHLSVNSTPSTTEKMVEKVNACEPDVILVAGDIFTSSYGGLKHPEKYSAALSKLKAEYGVYVVSGNHDVEENLFGGFSITTVDKAFRTKEMDKFFEDCGFKMLYDEVIELDGRNVVVAGRKDGEKAGNGTANRMDEHQLLDGIAPEKLTIVLEHEPMNYAALAENGADIVLAGHTHNGQMFPGNFIVPFFNENAYGVKTISGIPTVVTAGVGYYGAPMRVGTDSEITVVNIEY